MVSTSNAFYICNSIGGLCSIYQHKIICRNDLNSQRSCVRIMVLIGERECGVIFDYVPLYTWNVGFENILFIESTQEHTSYT